MPILVKITKLFFIDKNITKSIDKILTNIYNVKG